jgi:hemolysin III
MNAVAELLRPHYPTTGAKVADLVVHVVGLTLALVGGVTMLTLAVLSGQVGQVVAVGIYAAGLLAMLAFSTAYNFADAAHQPALKRLDQAGIFVMIAGSYTPFTTHALHGAWAWGMTAAVWTIAGLGALGKLLLRRSFERISIALYLALGWVMVIALRPLIQNLAWITLSLLLAGGLLYSTGVIFYVNRRLKFARAIWHGHVVAAAGAHWAAVLLGVVLAARP